VYQALLCTSTNAFQAAAAKRQASKDNRTARMDRDSLIELLFTQFRDHRIWGLRDLKAKVRQPEQYLRETLADIAFMHKQGDWNGKWELKEAFKNDKLLENPRGIEAPKVEDSDIDPSGMDDDDDEDVKFEDV
jgi:transcription initiation factor TFIIF subunit beta